jgi:hypothetical protein
MPEFTRTVRFEPAWDRRNSIPRKNYGVHGVEITFYLRGPEGVIQFKLYSGWHLPHVLEEWKSKGVPLPCPMAVDLGYHSPAPMYEGHTLITEKCEILDGKPCYYDGSSLAAEKIFNILLTEGDEAVWQAMEESYRQTFEKETADA